MDSPAIPRGRGELHVGVHLVGIDGVATLEVRVHRDVHRVRDGPQCARVWSSVTPLSAWPIVHANPALVVASAAKPSCANARALTTSHGFGITKQPDACKRRNSSTRSRRAVTPYLRSGRRCTNATAACSRAHRTRRSTHVRHGRPSERSRRAQMLSWGGRSGNVRDTLNVRSRADAELIDSKLRTDRDRVVISRPRPSHTT